jgi:tyrosyl-tRNA synthetase
MYQFWLNTDDADVITRLKIFTFLGRDEIERLERVVADEPFRREAQRTLAREVTALVHGPAATDAVIAASEALFGQGDLEVLDPSVLESALREVPNTTTTATTTVAQALVDTGLCTSLSEARRAIAQGGVYLNNTKVTDEAATLASSELPGGVAVLRRGKRTLAGAFLETVGIAPH